MIYGYTMTTNFPLPQELIDKVADNLDPVTLADLTFGAGIKVERSLIPRTKYGIIWTSILRQKDGKGGDFDLLYTAIQEKGNAFLIGHDLQKLSEELYNGNRPEPTHLILTWVGEGPELKPEKLHYYHEEHNIHLRVESPQTLHIILVHDIYKYITKSLHTSVLCFHGSETLHDFQLSRERGSILESEKYYELKIDFQETDFPETDLPPRGKVELKLKESPFSKMYGTIHTVPDTTIDWPLPQKITDEGLKYLDRVSLACITRVGVKLDESLLPRAQNGGVWASIFGRESINYLQNLLGEKGNAFLIGYDLQKLYNERLYNKKIPSCPSHLILTCIDETGELKPNDSYYSKESNVYILIQKPGFLLGRRGILVDNLNYYITKDLRTSILSFRGDERLRTVEVRLRERKYLRRAPYQYEFNIDFPPWKDILCLKSRAADLDKN